MAKSVFEILMKIDGDQKVKAAIGDLGKAAGLTGAALTAFSAGVAKTASDYEYSLAKVGTLADETTGSLDEFGAAIFNLSNEMDGAISANEAAAASYDVLSAGYKDQADVIGILEASQKAAIGGYSDLATVSDASTTIMNAYGDVLGENLSVTEKMTKVTDQMIQTQNLGKITADQYSRYIGSIASSAASLKIPFEEMNAGIAVATAQGVRVSSTFAGMGQIMAALSKPTKEAQTQAAALGIEFNAAAVESKGLSGVLQDIVDSGGAGQESLGKLFGSVEAVRVVTPLLSQEGAVLAKTLDGMKDSAGTASTAFEKMSDTDAVKAQNAMNKLNNAFISLGQGVLVAVSPLIDLLSKLVGLFNSLPTPIKQAIGLITAITGVALTVAGGLAILATGVTSLMATITTLTPIISGFAASLLGVQVVSFGAIATGLGSVALAAAAAVPWIVAIGMAVKLLADTWKYFQDIQKEKEANKFLQALEDTEPLVQQTEKLANSIRKTGEALPDAEFDAFIQKLKDADGGTGTLEGHIKALTNVQNKAKGITTENTAATEEGTIATEGASEANVEAALSAEELAAAEKLAADQFAEYTKSVNDYITALQSQKSVEISNLSTSGSGIEESLQKELEITQTYNDKIIAAKEALAAQSQTTEADRVKAQSDINQMLADEAKKVFDTEQKLRELNNQKTLDSLDTERNNVEQLYADKKILSADYNIALIDILNRELAAKLGVIDEELKSAKAGSSEYFELQKERSKLILDGTKEAAQINQQYNDEVVKQAKETAEKQQEIAENNLENNLKEIELRKLVDDAAYRNKEISLVEYSEKLVKALDKETELKLTAIDNELAGVAESTDERIKLEQKYVEIVLRAEEEKAQIVAQNNAENRKRVEELLQLELNSQKQVSQAIIDNRKLAQDQLANTDQFASGLEGILGRISSNLEKDNLTLEQRTQLEKVSQEVLNKSAELGLQVNSSLTLEQQIQEALNALEIKKLDIKKQQLLITQEIIKAESESAALDLQGTIDINQQKLTDPALKDTEKQALQQEIELNQKKLELLNQQTEAKLKSNEASLSLLDLEKSLALTEQEIAQNPALDQTLATSPTPTNTPSEGESLANEKLERTAQATQETNTKLEEVSAGTNTLPEANEKLTNLSTLTTTGNDNLGSISRSVEANNQAVTGSTTTLNNALQSINASIRQNGVTLGSINNAINALPGKIAASIPRPAPPTPVPSR